MADTEAIIRIRAEIENFKNRLNEARNQFQSFTNNVTKAAGPVGKALAAAFAVGVVKSFVETSVKEFAKAERSMDQLRRKIEATGESWAKVGGSVRGYLSDVQKATRFSDDETADALGLLVFKTNDLNAALALNERAMNLAVAANIPLIQAADSLALAYQGNTRGIAMLAKQLGIAGAEAKSAQAIFDELDAKTKGLARSEQGAATELAKLGNQLSDIQENIGSVFAPAVIGAGKLLIGTFGLIVSGLKKIVDGLATAIAASVRMVMIAFDALVRQGQAIGTFWRNVWKHPIEATKEYARSTVANVGKMGSELVALGGDVVDQLVEDWSDGEDDKTKATRDATAKRLIVSARGVDILKGLVRSEMDYWRDQEEKRVGLADIFTTRLTNLHKMYVRRKGETDEQYKERVKKDQEEIKDHVTRMYAFIDQLAHSFADEMSAVGAGWVEAWREHTLTVGGFFKGLAEGMLKFFLKAIGRMLVEEAAAAFARGIASALGIITAPLAPGWFAASAALGAAGGAIMAVADSVKLAEGGIVTGPTNAIVGEAGPEAVIPLNEFGALGGTSLTLGTVNMTFPGVRRESDLRGPRFARTASRELLDVLIQSQNRRGSKSV